MNLRVLGDDPGRPYCAMEVHVLTRAPPEIEGLAPPEAFLETDCRLPCPARIRLVVEQPSCQCHGLVLRGREFSLNSLGANGLEQRARAVGCSPDAVGPEPL